MKKNNETYVIYRLNAAEMKMEELFEIEGFRRDEYACKVIADEINDNYGFNENEIYPIIRFQNDVDYCGVVAVIAPYYDYDENVFYGAEMSWKDSLIYDVDDICRKIYENEEDKKDNIEKLISVISELGIFDEVCDFVADKILEND